MKKTFLFSLLTIVLFSCTSEKERKEAEKKEIEEQNKINKENIISKLVSKYNIKYQWDTLDYKLSIDFKPVIDSKYQLIDRIDINDVFEKDSSYFISVNISYYPTFYFTFPISQDQFEQIFNTDDNTDLILVVNITDIRKMQFTLNGEIEDSEYASINLERSDDFIGKGRIIEIASTKK